MFEHTLIDVLIQPLDTDYYDRLATEAPAEELHAMVAKTHYAAAFLATLFGFEDVLCPVDQPPAPIPTLLARAHMTLTKQSVYIIRASGWCVNVYKYWDAIRHISHLGFTRLDDAMWLNHRLMNLSSTDESVAAFNDALRFSDAWSIYHENPNLAYSIPLCREIAPEVIEMSHYDNSLRLGDIVLFTSPMNHPFSLFPLPNRIPTIEV